MEHLLIGDIGAIWAIRDQGGQFVRGCSGQITGTRVGPIRRWDLRLNTEFHPASFSGASYISLPKSLPPSEADSQWLTAEGLRGLVWGGGKWFANQVGPSSLSSQPFRRKRGVISENKGTVYATAPSLWRYPDFIMVNGTNYTDDGRGDLVYRNETGVILDLDRLGG